jgi:hypothetical protein
MKQTNKFTTWECYIRDTFKAIPHPEKTMLGKVPHTPEENRELLDLVNRMSRLSWMKNNG